MTPSCAAGASSALKPSTVIMDGSFAASTNFAAETFSAPKLAVSGGLKWRDQPTIDQACDVSVTQRGTGDSSKLGGTVCGRDFDENSLLSGGPSNATGGSGQGGSSATAGTVGADCSCFCPDGSGCTDRGNTSNPCGVDADGIPNACGCPVGCK